MLKYILFCYVLGTLYFSYDICNGQEVSHNEGTNGACESEDNCQCRYEGKHNIFLPLRIVKYNLTNTNTSLSRVPNFKIVECF